MKELVSNNLAAENGPTEAETSKIRLDLFDALLRVLVLAVSRYDEEVLHTEWLPSFLMCVNAKVTLDESLEFALLEQIFLACTVTCTPIIGK